MRKRALRPLQRTFARFRAGVRRFSVEATRPDDDARAYQRDGAVVLRGLLSGEQVATLREAIEWNLSNPGPLAGVASCEEDPGAFLEDFCNWSRVPGYQDVIFNSAIAEVGAALMASSTARLYHDHVLVKEAGTQQPTPWHQDQPYYNISGRQNVSFWIPVDRGELHCLRLGCCQSAARSQLSRAFVLAVPRESTLEFVAGSHEGTWYMPKTFLTEQSKWFPEGSLANVPDVASGALRLLLVASAARILTVTLRASLQVATPS